MVRGGCDIERRVVLAAVSGNESVDIAAVERHHDGPVRLGYRLATQPEGAGDVGQGPRFATVGGPGHLHSVAGTRIVPFHVAVPVVGAGGPVVAGDPALVEEGSRIVRGGDRVLPH